MPPIEKKGSFLGRRLEGWMLRHQLAFNFWIHMIGIPMSVLSLFLLLGAPWINEYVPWYWSLGGFVLGYVLQWIGHLAREMISASGPQSNGCLGGRMLAFPLVGIRKIPIGFDSTTRMVSFLAQTSSKNRV